MKSVIGKPTPVELKSYGNPVHFEATMDTISVNKFRDNLKTVVEQVISRHEPVKVTRRAGQDFVVVSAEDWEREQETLHVLQNKDLMRQIADSLDSHTRKKGRAIAPTELDEILDL